MKYKEKVMDLSEDTLWQAVLNRDSRYDGICHYGVLSTGIYCRFHCPSKRPLRENVRFFFSTAGAEKAGFQPCKRCHPEKAGEPGVDDSVSKVITVCRYIESCDYIPTLKELSEQVNLSPFHLQRVFKKVLGISPRSYADALRQLRLKRALKGGDDIALASYDAGYGSSSRIYEQSPHYLGMTPKAYKEQGKGHLIYYSIVESFLGLLLLAATEKGICAIRMGDSQQELVDELNKEFEKADIHETDAELSGWTQKLIDYLSGSAPWPELPYDVKATAFQRKVWDYLRTIPEGQTKHYSEIAASIGQPKAARAVAQACAANSAAIVIPCHRVVPKTGGIGGYRWGTERKKKLLEMEKQKQDF
jgi:AraC family transcriptional regulator of adaptative response/methylated-DNA-[protein]-cysteine methyltransferase